MARRYTVSTSLPLATVANPVNPVLDAVVDVPVLLSQRLQRMVRQGHVVRFHRIQAALKPGGGDLDIGVAFQGFAEWCPATKNSVNAWQHVFNAWRKQKALHVGATGAIVKGDDFEVGWSRDLISLSGRASNVVIDDDGSILDGSSTSAPVAIYGISTDGGLFTNSCLTLEDVYESARQNPTATARSSFWYGQTVKSPKWTHEFPNPVGIPLSAHWSAINEGEDGVNLLNSIVGFDSGATVSYQDGYIQDGASLGGVLHVGGYMLPENTVSHLQDDLELMLTITVSLGTPLHISRRKSSTRKRTGRYTAKSRRSTSGRKYRRRR